MTVTMIAGEKQMSRRAMLERARKAWRKEPLLFDLLDNGRLPVRFHWSSRSIVLFRAYKVRVSGRVGDVCLTVFVGDLCPPSFRGAVYSASEISEVAVITSNQGGDRP